MEYRIKYIKGIGYYPQVKTWKYGFWYRISRHMGGLFGLYASSEHPLESEDLAKSVIDDYHQYCSCIHKQTVSYTKYNPQQKVNDNG